MLSSFFLLSSNMHINDFMGENISSQSKFQKDYDGKYSWAVLDEFHLPGHATGKEIKVNKVRSDGTVHISGQRSRIYCKY